MVGREMMIPVLVAVMLVAAVTALLHDRHYRQRRDRVRDARLDAIEEGLPPEARARVLEARMGAVESILLEDETT